MTTKTMNDKLLVDIGITPDIEEISNKKILELEEQKLIDGIIVKKGKIAPEIVPSVTVPPLQPKPPTGKPIENGSKPIEKPSTNSKKNDSNEKP